jgi:hypothetical protein
LFLAASPVCRQAAGVLFLPANCSKIAFALPQYPPLLVFRRAARLFVKCSLLKPPLEGSFWDNDSTVGNLNSRKAGLSG